jgi:hypothetical protein
VAADTRITTDEPFKCVFSSRSASAHKRTRNSFAEMIFIRRTVGYIWSDLKKNTEILEELEVNLNEEKISNYKTDWRDHVNRVSRSRSPKLNAV